MSQANTINSIAVGRAADHQVDRKRRQRDDAAEQSRCDKGAMARGRQRIVLRRGVHERGDIISYRREEAHVPDRTLGFADALPFFYPAIVSDGA